MVNAKIRFVLAATAGGVAASFAMDAVQTSVARIFERGRTFDERDEEVEAIDSVVRLLGTFAPALARAGRARVTARALHYGFGIAFAYAYVAVAERVPFVATGNGIAFGTALFVVTDRIVIPTFGLGRPWRGYSKSERFNAFASHVAYGVVLESLRARTLRTPRDSS